MASNQSSLTARLTTLQQSMRAPLGKALLAKYQALYFYHAERLMASLLGLAMTSMTFTKNKKKTTDSVLGIFKTALLSYADYTEILAAIIKTNRFRHGTKAALGAIERYRCCKTKGLSKNRALKSALKYEVNLKDAFPATSFKNWGCAVAVLEDEKQIGSSKNDIHV